MVPWSPHPSSLTLLPSPSSPSPDPLRPLACFPLLNPRFKIHPTLTVAEFRHWLTPLKGVVNSYVSHDSAGKVNNLCSFYHLPSSVLNNPLHKTINAAYSYYNVPSEDSSLTTLMADCLHLAQKEGIDVFNCLDLMENKEFLEELKFGAGDGTLRYYLFNMACPEVREEDIGLVLL